MEGVYSALQAGIENSKSDTETARFLLEFQKSIFPSTCSEIRRKELTDWFVKIWEILLKCISSESTVVRISTYSAASAFLVRMTPYFPRYMISAFSTIASRDVHTTNHGVILVSAFAFLTNFLNPPVLDEFLQNTPIFHRFVGSDSLDSEYLSQIIANLSDLGTSWFQTLLAALIRRNGQSPSRSVMKAICSVIGRDPEAMMTYLVSLNVRDMVLIAYIVRSLGERIRNVDMYQFALLAMDVLRKHGASAPAVDAENACQILAAKSNSFELALKVIGEDEIELTVERRGVEDGKVEAKRNGLTLEEIYAKFDGEEKQLTEQDVEAEMMAMPLEGESDSEEEVKIEGMSWSSHSSGRLLDLLSYGSNISEDCFWLREEAATVEPVVETEATPEEVEVRERESAVLSVKNFKMTPAFYLLPLPTQPFLVPDVHDSASVLAAKMTNVAMQISDSNEIQDVEEKIAFLNQYCQGEYNNVVSACLQCLSLCVNSLIMNTKSNMLPQILRRVLFAKIVSWFHASDILRVVQAIRVDLIPMILGKNSLREIVKLVLGFAVNPNAKLRTESRKTINNIITWDNVDQIVLILIENIDYYLPMSLQVHLGILTDIMRKFKTKHFETIDFMARTVIEVADFYSDDIYTISSILEFMSLIDLKAFDPSAVTPLIEVATPIVRAGVNFLTGWDTPSELSSYYEMISRFVTSNSVEIISEGAHIYCERYRCIYAALVFLLALPKSLVDIDVHIKICVRLYRFFPDEVTEYLLYKQKRIPKQKRLKMIYEYMSKLDFVKMSSVHAKWCEIFVRNAQSLDSRKLYRGKGNLRTTAIWYMQNPTKASVSELVPFAHFLVTQDRNQYKTVLAMIYSLSEEQQQEFFDCASVRFMRCRKWFPSIRKEAFWDQFAYILPRQKDTVLEDICNLPAPTMVNPDVIEYGNKKLKGWKLMFFKRNTEQDLEKLEYRPFNPFFADDELPVEKKILYLIESGNPGDLQYLLDSVDKVDISNASIATGYVRPVMMWLKKKRKIKLMKKLTSEYHIADLDTERHEWAIMAMLCDPGRFVKEFVESQKLSKAQICALIQAIPHIQLNEHLIYALVIRMFDDIKSTRRMSVVMTLTEAVLERCPNSPPTFSKVFCDCVQAKPVEYFTANVMKVTAKLHGRSKFDAEQESLVQQLIKFFSPFAPDYFHLYCGPVSELVSLLTALLGRENPSLSEKWLRVLRTLSRLEDEKMAIQRVSSFLPQVYEISAKHQGNFRVNECVFLLLKHIFTTNRLSPLYEGICEEYFTKLLPGQEQAHYAKFLSIIPCMFPFLVDNSPAMNRVMDIENGLMPLWMPLDIFKVYISIVRSILVRCSDLEARQEKMESFIMSWLEKQANFDSYYYQFYLKEWIQMMREFSSLKSMLMFLLFHFMKQPTRCFPFIAALTQLLQKIIVFASPEEKLWINEKLIEACEIPGDPRAVKALKLVSENKYHEAIDAVLV